SRDDSSGREGLDDLPPGARLIGVAPHIDADTLRAAVAGGCAEALPRSVFFKRLPALIGREDD
ncbi:MAG: hypothetical protein VX785_01210, partial [Actinomycetota bacterium]|nr:hypothetical protein [Actinomycetota bacterium]